MLPKSIRLLALAIVTLLLALSTQLPARGAEVIRLTNGEWPPYQSPELPHYGAASWLAQRAFEIEGYQVEYSFFPWNRAYYMAQTGQYDGSLIWSYSEERAKHFIYSDPFLYTNTVFFFNREKPIDWDRWEDLQGLIIGATSGYHYGTAFDEAERKGIFTVDRVSSDELNLKKLIAGRIDAFPLSLDVGRYMLRTQFNDIERGRLDWHPKPLRKTAYHLIISRKSPRAQELVDAFNRGVAKLKASGEYERIMQSVLESIRPR
ncbi:MAG: amino acid ABC transporter substrate-binding protein [Gammaproteobacteria bacterium]|nr:MAG: amino acid ABC transporter substrate-binding protein [Gammaproteobacteria bacterium]